MDHQAAHSGSEMLRLVSVRAIAIRLAQGGLLASVVLLAVAPLALPDGYSVIDNTLSEAGGQGIVGAWVQRLGVLLTSASVATMLSIRGAGLNREARRWLGVYAVALVFLVIFPEAPWTGAAHNSLVARLHTAAGVVGAVSFILGAFFVWRDRPVDQAGRRAYDWFAIAAVASIPQVMLVLPADGLWQRLMVLVGYGWLLAESGRISSKISKRDPTSAIRR